MDERQLSNYLATKAENTLLVKHNKDLIQEISVLKNKIKQKDEKISSLCEKISDIDDKLGNITLEDFLNSSKQKKSKEYLQLTKEDVKEIKKDLFVQSLENQNKKKNELIKKLRNTISDLVSKLSTLNKTQNE